MRKAFTLLELVFVIVVIGILAALILPHIKTNPVQEAAVQVLSHVRYTQHLALVDDKYNSSNLQWYLGRWQIFFSNANATKSYLIFSERKNAYNGNPDSNNAYTNSEVARNPQNPNTFLIGTPDSNFAHDDTTRITKKLDLGASYGIVDFKISGGGTSSSANRILFDYLGRPYRGTTNTSSATVINSPFDRLANSPIFIKICHQTCNGNNDMATNDDEVVIRIEKETGYACILEKNSDSQCRK